VEIVRTGKLVIDLCIVNGIPGCATDCYSLDEWEVVSKAEQVGDCWPSVEQQYKAEQVGDCWPSVEQQYKAVQSGVEALVWAYNAWFGVRRRR